MKSAAECRGIAAELAQIKVWSVGRFHAKSNKLETKTPISPHKTDEENIGKASEMIKSAAECRGIPRKSALKKCRGMPRNWRNSPAQKSRIFRIFTEITKYSKKLENRPTKKLMLEQKHKKNNKLTDLGIWAQIWPRPVLVVFWTLGETAVGFLAKVA